MAGGGAAAFLFYRLLAVFPQKQAAPPSAGPPVDISDLGLILLVFCALVALTVLLESTSSIWYPGSRSRMVQQGFQPVVYLSVLFLLAEFAFRRTGRRVDFARDLGVVLLCAFATVLGLEYNRQLVEQTTFEHKLETQLKRVLPAIVKPTHFVVKMKAMKWGVWYSGKAPTMPSLFAQAAYNSNSVWLAPFTRVSWPEAPNP